MLSLRELTTRKPDEKKILQHVTQLIANILLFISYQVTHLVAASV